MKFNLDEHTDTASVTAYAEGWVRVGDRRVEQPCVIAADGLTDVPLPPTPLALEISHFGPIVAAAPEIILLGTGGAQVFVAYEIVAALAAENIALEIMDTGAACRSYNILLAEARRVVAVLYMI